jgi:hypothetical protein
MITKKQLKEHKAELQEITDEFYRSLGVGIAPNDNIVNEEVRQHALKCAGIYISQVHRQMDEALELCQPIAKPEQVASADPFLRETDLSVLGISAEQAAHLDMIAIKQDTIAREDDVWLETERRS